MLQFLKMRELGASVFGTESKVQRTLCVAACGLTMAMLATNVQAELVSNGGFDIAPANQPGNGHNWGVVDTWQGMNFGDRAPHSATGGNTGGYVGTSTDGTANGAITTLVIDTSTANDSWTSGTGLNFSFDVLNDTGADASFDYVVLFAEDGADGAWALTTDQIFNRSPYSFIDSNDFNLLESSVTAPASSGWTNSGNIAIDFSTITLPGAFDYGSFGPVFPSSATIDSFDDITRVIIGIKMANPSGVSTGIGFDNVSLTATAVPEPSSLALLSLVGVAAVGRRRRRASK